MLYVYLFRLQAKQLGRDAHDIPTFNVSLDVCPKSNSI